MGQLAQERLRAMEDLSYKYFDWLTVLGDAGITEIQDLQGQYLLKCPFHEDWSPSFRIRLHEHNYHCFSCNAFGSVIDLMWKLSGADISKSQYMENVLKRSPGMQRELGFQSLYIDSKTLDPGFERRRRFSAKDHIGSGIPYSVLSRRVKEGGDTWENLVYSLSLLQMGERPENILAFLRAKREFLQGKVNATAGVLSVEVGGVTADGAGVVKQGTVENDGAVSLLDLL